MGNKHTITFVQCAREIVERSFLILSPATFDARRCILRDGHSLLARLKTIYAPMIYIPVPKEQHISFRTKRASDMEWHLEWGVLNNLVDVLEESSPTQEDMVHAKPYLGRAIEILERGVGRWCGVKGS